MTVDFPEGSLQDRMLAGQASAIQRPKSEAGLGRLSGVSVNENLLLESIGWEAVELISGAAIWGMRRDTLNTWGADQDARASTAFSESMGAAVERFELRCRAVGGHGVLGVEIKTEIEPRYVSVNLIGTAVRPRGNVNVPDRAFTSNLSPQAFVLLTEAGWTVLGLASGCQFVRSYRRSPTQTMTQNVQNVELVNPTQALATARAETMIQLEQRAHLFGGEGVIQVVLNSGPVPFATHVQSFIAWGTVVASTPIQGPHSSTRMAISMNDVDSRFDPARMMAAPKSESNA